MFVWFLLVFVVLGVFFLLVCLCFPHASEINSVVCEVVCEVEGPSELSWRARHGRKKIVLLGCSYGWDLIVFWFGVVGVGVCCLVFVGCVGLVVFLGLFCCSSRSFPFLVAFTQKM